MTEALPDRPTAFAGRFIHLRVRQILQNAFGFRSDPIQILEVAFEAHSLAIVAGSDYVSKNRAFALMYDCHSSGTSESSKQLKSPPRRASGRVSSPDAMAFKLCSELASWRLRLEPTFLPGHSFELPIAHNVRKTFGVSFPLLLTTAGLFNYPIDYGIFVARKLSIEEAALPRSSNR